MGLLPPCPGDSCRPGVVVHGDGAAGISNTGKGRRGVRRSLGTEHADQARLTELLGKDWRSYIPREGVERSDVDAFLKQYHEQHKIEKPVTQGDPGGRQ
jgi:hypothetical protein